MTHVQAAQMSAERMRRASDWVQTLADPATGEQAFIEWQQWCAESPDNARAFAQMQEVWDGLAPARVARVAPPRGRRWWVPLSVAASLLVLAGAAFFLVQRSPAEEFQTNIGEVRQQELADGSRLDIGADSRVVVKYSDERRDLQLERGRAFFVVKKDAVRPFVVRTGAVSVTAVGTSFDVRETEESIIVSVSEGRVKIADAREAVLADAGQRVSYSKETRALTVTVADPRLTESWRHGVLQFQEEPLRDVVSEVNRYTRRPVILDPELESIPFTGTISTERMDDWFIALERILPVMVEQRTREVHIERNPRRRDAG